VESNATATDRGRPTFDAGDAEISRLAVIGAVNTDTENFGGVYIDDDGALVVQYVGSNDGRANVERYVTAGLAVRWVKVERSRAELNRIKTEIRDRHLEEVNMIALDTKNNQIRVFVGTGEAFESIARVLAEEFGDAVAVARMVGAPVVDTASTLSPPP